MNNAGRWPACESSNLAAWDPARTRQWCSRIGVDVVRVRRPGGLTMPAEDRDLLHRGKQIVDLDVKTQPQALLEFVAKADVLLDCFRPGTCERLGIGPDDCGGRPRLIFARITGWGQDRPRASTAGHDIYTCLEPGAGAGLPSVRRCRRWIWSPTSVAVKCRVLGIVAAL